jgi:multidrug efflux pump subunit AcrA (membrane-fusion protein)
MNHSARKPGYGTAFLITGTALLLTGCDRDAAAEDPEESKTTAPVPVRCVTASVTTLRPSIELLGVLVAIPEKTVVLSTQFAGQVRSISIVEGQHVQTGEELLRLDDRPTEAQRAKARAVVAENRAVLDRLKHGSRPEDIDAARQDLQRAEANLRPMLARLESATKLHETHVIPELEFAQRKSAAEAAEADVAASRAKLTLLEIGPRPEEIAEVEAKLAGAEADLAACELAWQSMRVTAPIDGFATEVPIRQGMFVASGTTLVTLADLSTLFARTRVPTAYLAQIHEAGKIDVRVPAFPDGVASGTLARLSKQADAQTGDVEALATVPNPGGQLRPGLGCRLWIWLPEIPEALAVPVAAIADRDGAPVVTVVRDDKAHEVEVQLGGRTTELVQITNGLSSGDLVAVEGGYGLPDGCPCKVLLESPATSSSATESP